MAARKQTLLERQFEASEDDRGIRNQALKELRNYNMSNIDQAPAGVLATIDNKTLSGLISAHTSKLAKPSAIRKLPARDIQVMREIQLQQQQMSEQLGRPVEISETPMHQIVVGKLARDKSPEEVRLQVTKALANDPLFSQKTTEEVNEMVNQLTENILRDVAPVGQGLANPALNRALEKFKSQRAQQNQTIQQ